MLLCFCPYSTTKLYFHRKVGRSGLVLEATHESRAWAGNGRGWRTKIPIRQHREAEAQGGRKVSPMQVAPVRGGWFPTSGGSGCPLEIAPGTSCARPCRPWSQKLVTGNEDTPEGAGAFEDFSCKSVRPRRIMPLVFGNHFRWEISQEITRQERTCAVRLPDCRRTY